MTGNEEEGWVLDMNKKYIFFIRGDILESKRRNKVYFSIDSDLVLAYGLRSGFGTRLLFESDKGILQERNFHSPENEVLIKK